MDAFRHRPELEHDGARSASLGYEEPGSYGCVRYLEHGYPNPLVRWHYHEEYELHLILGSSGRVFVGDYIGQFEPGHLVLTGPRLPHNWISLDTPPGGLPERDILLQFPDAPMRQAAEALPEFAEVLQLLERARHGIEFFGISEAAERAIRQVHATHGIERFAVFVELLQLLTRCADYRLLSSVQLQSLDDAKAQARIARIIDYLTEHSAANLSMARIARLEGMSESAFSRFFQRATGNTFTDFVNRLRVHKACQLLMETDAYVANVCFDVGFNNVAHFNRQFLRIKGVTPSQFRQQASTCFARR